MPTFDTPQPISVSIDLLAGGGGVGVEASDRRDTVVEITPRDPANGLDVEVAAQARVDFADGTLTIKTGTRWQSMFSRRSGTVDVTLRVPSGSHVRGTTYLGDLRFDGPLGQCQFKTYLGDVEVSEAASVHLTTSMGKVTVDRVGGECHVTGTGEVRIRHIGGAATVKNLNGNTWIGDVAGDLSVNSANGDIAVERTGGNINARTAFGSVHIGEIARGTAELQSAAGRLDIGIRAGTAAWLDVKSAVGRVHNNLEPTGQPGPEWETAQIRGRTAAGDIVIHRSAIV